MTFLFIDIQLNIFKKNFFMSMLGIFGTISEEWHVQTGIEYWLGSIQIWPVFPLTFNMTARPVQERVKVVQIL